MTTTSFADELLTRLDEVLADFCEMSLPILSDDDLEALLTRTTTFGNRLTHATGRVATEATTRELSDKVGARHAANWWASLTRLTPRDANRRLRLARSLARTVHEPVADALASGELHVDQAGVIVDVVDDLPSDLEPALVDKARDILLDEAQRHNADELRILGKHILETIDPERFEADEAKRLKREEDEANARARITLTNDGHGRVLGRFSLPAVQGELLRNQLLALADPRRTLPGAPSGDDSAAPRDGSSITPERMGHAFMELIEMFPADKLPSHAASSVALMITIDISQLLKEHGFATLANGQRISAGEARRLACRSGLLPAVLDGRSEILDFGRQRRLFSTAQFRALALRDKGCTAKGCGMPPSVCHAHHDDPWSHGGPTDLARGRLLCPHHHRLIHHQGYRHSIEPDNTVTFRRLT
ncbi:hypothetical protein BJ980_000006 [Nocardioides daedukensis]|uniref:HNH nuclease domain-containing protein n=1 Tax=Nocardioides daedukensis TaxID=634462 RepID=A0A7Y9RYT9_9ACTN|nr:HNH endonuclease signature motif containing protein [Nocardioides daedukensis]NYG57083.1 hypothetical protein [Nocardioides daedukensis]